MLTRELLAKDSEAFVEIVETAPAMLWLGDENGQCVFLNRHLREFWGVTDLAEFDWAATVHPDDAEKLAHPYLKAMQERSPFEIEARFRRADGEYRLLRTAARPRLSSAGAFCGMAGVNTDVTDQRQAEADLRRSSEQLELALDAAQGVGAWVWDLQRNLVVADHRFAAAFRVSPEEAAAGLPIEAFLHAIADEDRPRVTAEIERSIREGGNYRCEYRVRRSDGSLRWLLATGRCSAGSDQAPAQFAGCIIDISDRKAQEDQLGLLTRELSHRIKNIFAIVQGLTSFTRRQHPEAAAAFDELRGRFAAMAAAYDCVRPSDNGAPVSTSLKDLLRVLFAPYVSSGRERIEIQGCDIPIGPKTASSLALILHERATNAAKYGALSDAGSVQLLLAMDDVALTMRWIESGGPLIVNAPETQGFGSRLIRMTADSLGAELELQWLAEGLQWQMSIPKTALRT
ncbi:MAG: PAS domain-containing protein [Beijerinckiaceae bacterium]|nr:PAS domain-containing protein [Beijerinckiaceae bacterium]